MRRDQLGTRLFLSWLLLLNGCTAVTSSKQSTSTFVAKSETPPAIRYCFDSVGHIAGSKPFILGGTCVCTPTPELLKTYQRDGYLPGYSYEGLLNLYKKRQIKTAHDHQGCNNFCQWGPHLVKGGSCMVPPTPGTQNYEEILSGRFLLSPRVQK